MQTNHSNCCKCDVRASARQLITHAKLKNLLALPCVPKCAPCARVQKATEGFCTYKKPQQQSNDGMCRCSVTELLGPAPAAEDKQNRAHHTCRSMASRSERCRRFLRQQHDHTTGMRGKRLHISLSGNTKQHGERRQCFVYCHIWQSTSSTSSTFNHIAIQSTENCQQLSTS
jgi:hypothetical protein